MRDMPGDAKDSKNTGAGLPENSGERGQKSNICQFFDNFFRPRPNPEKNLQRVEVTLVVSISRGQKEESKKNKLKRFGGE